MPPPPQHTIDIYRALMREVKERLSASADTVEALRANTAYANRRRDPLFAAMWEAALGIARDRLADALLARSIEGSVEYYYRDGELVGEKRHIDNRLGLAVLRCLDRLAEIGSPLPLCAHQDPVLLRRQEPSSALTGPLPAQGNNGRPPALDWDQMIGALRTGEPGAMATALAALKACPEPGRRGHETHETHDPPESLVESLVDGAEDDEIEDGKTRVWQSDGDWWTEFPPPAGFKGVEHGKWGSFGYKRACTADEIALLDAIHTLDRAGERAAEDAERTAYFADIAAELAEEAEYPPTDDADDPPPSSSPT